MSKNQYYNSVYQEDNNLFTTSSGGKIECVGVIPEAYLELKKQLETVFDKAEEYQALLVKHGLIEAVESTEDVVKRLEQRLLEQEQISQKTLSLLESLSSKLDKEKDKGVRANELDIVNAGATGEKGGSGHKKDTSGKAKG